MIFQSSSVIAEEFLSRTIETNENEFVRTTSEDKSALENEKKDKEISKSELSDV